MKKEQFDKCNYCQLHSTIKTLENEKAELRLSRNKLYDELQSQLTKAKEIIKDITSSYGSTEVSEAQLYLKIKKAEQFLNEK